MHGAEHQRGGGAVFQQLLHKKCGDFLRIGWVRKLHFGRKSIGIQPFQQLFAVCADHFCLREMDVGVDKARNNQLIGIVLHLNLFRDQALPFIPWAKPLDDAIFTEK